MQRILVVGALLLISRLSFSQEVKPDSIQIIKSPDTVLYNSGKPIEIKSYATRYDPRKALLYSAVFPGMGQFYNKKYWKMPLVYGGFVTVVVVVDFYAKAHKDFRNDLFIKLSDPSSGNSFPTVDQLRRAVDRSRRERDFFIIMGGVWYLLQLVDAHVDAHLKEFDLNPKLQVKIEPMMENNSLVGRNTGIALRLRF